MSDSSSTLLERFARIKKDKKRINFIRNCIPPNEQGVLNTIASTNNLNKPVREAAREQLATGQWSTSKWKENVVFLEPLFNQIRALDDYEVQRMLLTLVRNSKIEINMRRCAARMIVPEHSVHIEVLDVLEKETDPEVAYGLFSSFEPGNWDHLASFIRLSKKFDSTSIRTIRSSFIESHNGLSQPSQCVVEISRLSEETLSILVPWLAKTSERGVLAYLAANCRYEGVREMVFHRLNFHTDPITIEELLEIESSRKLRGILYRIKNHQ